MSRPARVRGPIAVVTCVLAICTALTSMAFPARAIDVGAADTAGRAGTGATSAGSLDRLSSSAATHGGASATASSWSAGPSAPARAQAERVLARAERLLRPTTGPKAHDAGGPSLRSVPDASVGGVGVVPRRSHHDVTLALRDLAVHRADLPAAGRRLARSLIERPLTSAAIGTTELVVHYNPTEVAADYPQRVLDTATLVHDTYLAAGYREPKTDGIAGGDNRLDIYLTDLGSTGAYGYCASDRQSAGGRADRSAFCVLDNDYSTKQYPGNPTEILQVTLAHEYFHAVQFAYDALEDGWFMEGTAVWAEDQVFDDVNDNMQYAAFSPLADPRISLDIFEQDDYRQYGAWLWFRYLSERYPQAQAGMPTIVRDMWADADSTRSGPNLYSLKAIAKTLRAYGTTLPETFARFADANRRPTAFYSEAAANAYPTAPLAATFNVSKKRSKTTAYRLDHLTSATTRFVPVKVAGKKYRLRLRLDLADRSRGSVAVVTSYLLDGRVKTRLAKLDRRGDTITRVPFSSDTVSGVEVTLVNASQRFTSCNNYRVKFSCYGRPLDQTVTERVGAAVVRR